MVTASPVRRPRVGHISFLNCLPLFWGLARTGSLIGLDLVKDTPENLSDALVDGRLDISPVSLCEFLRHRDVLTALPGIAIGCDGPVMSCLVVSKVPLEQLDGELVALSSTSRTTVELAKLLLSERVGVCPEYFSCAPDLELMLESASAAVIIGDIALRTAVHEAAALGLQVYDLGQMWREWTGLPFVFAVMATRHDFLEREPETVRRVHSELLTARDLAEREMDELCRQLSRWENFDAHVLGRYFTEALDFSFGDRQRAGIEEFADRIGIQSN
ncbi:menaquinone biosynthesis protein [Nocardia sp. CC201C]|uniref:menaquinone biosynthetic enzyme MqnA/MqnD family protein n=1 Tax=Nocardia sp. CC201C TaxID=3044575 RepID=UPI0024A98AAF|nr:menaquinone biosynthesis protein [Nocardia sp. CC201C]